MTLDCSYPLIRSSQPRVISVHSYYLTSLVNLAFYRFDKSLFFYESHSAARSLHLISHQREALMGRVCSLKKESSWARLLFVVRLCLGLEHFAVCDCFGACCLLWDDVPSCRFLLIANSFCFSLVPNAIAFGHQRFAFCNLFSAFHIHFPFYATA